MRQICTRVKVYIDRVDKCGIQVQVKPILYYILIFPPNPVWVKLAIYNWVNCIFLFFEETRLQLMPNWMTLNKYIPNIFIHARILSFAKHLYINLTCSSFYANVINYSHHHSRSISLSCLYVFRFPGENNSSWC